MEYSILDLEWNQPVSRSRMVKSPIRLSLLKHITPSTTPLIL